MSIEKKLSGSTDIEPATRNRSLTLPADAELTAVAGRLVDQAAPPSRPDERLPEPLGALWILPDSPATVVAGARALSADQHRARWEGRTTRRAELTGDRRDRKLPGARIRLHLEGFADRLT